MKFAVIRFPGSNCERDCLYIIESVLGLEASLFDYRQTPIFKDNFDCVILPGGFSFGDYLRAGAIAKTAPIMQSVKQFAHIGGLVLGICNGFQVLTEAKLLPGILKPNLQGRFICQNQNLQVINASTPCSNLYQADEIIQMPIAHAEGNYQISAAELTSLRENRQIILEYQSNPNGSVSSIAGVCNARKNVFGLMPHPERCCEGGFSGNDGLKLFQSLMKNKLY